MNKQWICGVCSLVLGCAQTAPSAPVPTHEVTQASLVQAHTPIPVDAAIVQPDVQALTSEFVPPVKQATPPKEGATCTAERTRIEDVYQQALAKPVHRVCEKDNQCLLLPNRTLCSDAVCIRESAPVNRTHAKTLKAIQYEADLKTCIDLTRECKPTVYKRRGTRCGTQRFKAVCEASLCTVKVVTRKPTPKAAPKTSAQPKAIKPKKQRKTKAQQQSPGAQLILGATQTPDRRYKMDITQTLMFARNAAYDACLDYPGSKNGTITFEFSVTPKGTLSRLRQKRSSLPTRMGLCLKTWLKSLEYPEPKKRTATVTQVIRYIAP